MLIKRRTKTQLREARGERKGNKAGFSSINNFLAEFKL